MEMDDLRIRRQPWAIYVYSDRDPGLRVYDSSTSVKMAPGYVRPVETLHGRIRLLSFDTCGLRTEVVLCPKQNPDKSPSNICMCLSTVAFTPGS